MRKSNKQRKHQNRKKTLKSKKQKGGYVVKLQDYHENIDEYNKIPATYRLIVLKGSNYSIEEHGRTTNLTTDKHIEYIITYNRYSKGVLVSYPYRLESTEMKRPQEYMGSYDPTAQEFTLIRLNQPVPLKIIYHLDESKQYIETPLEIDPTHSKLKADILREVKSDILRDVKEMMSSKSTGVKSRELQDINALLSSSEGRVSRLIKEFQK
jgi:hypothetical protein